VNGPAGIYRITNVVTGEFYIGRAEFIHARTRSHFNKLAAGKHKNHLFQSSFDEHGREAFMVTIERLGDWLCGEEWELIGKLRPAFNLAGPHIPQTSKTKGKPRPEHSRKMREAWARRRQLQSSD
jgi:hypothetical protein